MLICYVILFEDIGLGQHPPPGDKSSLKVIYYNTSKNTVTQLAQRRFVLTQVSSVQSESIVLQRGKTPAKYRGKLNLAQFILLYKSIGATW